MCPLSPFFFFSVVDSFASHKRLSAHAGYSGKNCIMKFDLLVESYFFSGHARPDKRTWPS